MGLNKSIGNMYSFVSHTFNTIKGECPHNCSYCYCKRWGKQPELHFDERELKTDLGDGNFIFVGSSCDMFAEGIPRQWIIDTLTKCNWYSSLFLFQSKDPMRMAKFLLDDWIVKKRVVTCTTIETNRFYPCKGASPPAESRAIGMERLSDFRRFVTIEPILDFDLEPMLNLIRRCEPVQVNIGADSGRNGLPEPSAAKVLALIEELSKFTTVVQKKNLARILNGA